MLVFYYLGRSLSAFIRWLRGIVRSSARGRARWMNWAELRIFFKEENKGLVLAPNHRLSLKESYNNLGLVAPTGTGKTTKFVIPNILLCEGSVIVTDPSGEIFKATSGHMKDRGYNIRVFNPSDPLKSLRFNRLKYAGTKQQLRQLATTLCNNNTGSDPFWQIMTINIIYVCLCALLNYPIKDFFHLGNIRWLLNHFGAAGEGVEDFMTNYLDKSTFSEYKAFIAQDFKVIASILSSARAALDLWSDPDIVRVTASDSIGIENLRKEKTIIYIIVPEHQVRYFSILINLFYSACFEFCLENPGDKKGDLPVFFFLDEFGNLGRIYNFASIATTLRKRRCSINIIMQELSQLEAIYGRNEARAMFSGGMGNKLFYSGLDLETCTYLEKVLGSNTEYDTTWGGINHAYTVITQNSSLRSYSGRA